MTSIYMCYQDEKAKDFDRWENETTRVLREILENPKHPKFKKVAERLEVLNDEGKLVDYYEENIDGYEPIYNYIHILETTNQDEDLILEVALKTNCCVLYDSEEEKNYIALTGCGMDMSQDIGLAYLILERWIPEDFINKISTQKGLTQEGEDWKKLRNAIIEQSNLYKNRFERLAVDWLKTEE